MTGTKEFRAWQSMWGRVKNSLRHNFKDYGGRGITVDQKYRDFSAFLADVGLSPSAKHSLDRIDSNGHYAPGNLRWATPEEQHRNRRDNVYIELNGVRRSLPDWAEICGIPASTLHDRFCRRGWEPERALNTPRRKWRDI
jgi:hypothetical protein